MSQASYLAWPDISSTGRAQENLNTTDARRRRLMEGAAAAIAMLLVAAGCSTSSPSSPSPAAASPTHSLPVATIAASTATASRSPTYEITAPPKTPPPLAGSLPVINSCDPASVPGAIPVEAPPSAKADSFTLYVPVLMYHRIVPFAEAGNSIVGLVVPPQTFDAQLTGEFSLTGSMAVSHWLHTATLMQDGRVLIVGGYDASDFTGTGEAPGPGQSIPAVKPGPADPRRIAELYDPKTGTFSRTGSMAVDRYGDTATLLRDGRVLIVGGESLRSGIVASAELYDPNAGTFSATGSMSASRTGHTATLLPDGDVLIAGGYNPAGFSLASAELYDPTTGRFSLTGSMSTQWVGKERGSQPVTDLAP